MNNFIKIKYKKNISAIVKKSDEEIVDAYKAGGDSNLIGELFQRYTHLVLAVCVKYLRDEEKAKDAVMDIFMELLDKLMTHQVDNFKGWLYSVTKNHCLMIIRKEKSKEKMMDHEKEKNRDLVMESEQELHLFDEEEMKYRGDGLEKAIQKLKQEQKICIELMYLKDKSYKEIVGITGYSMKQVKSFIQNGKRNLKNFLEST